MGARGPKAVPFYDRVHKTAGCWEWTGKKFTNGYGRAIVDRKSVGAHRVAWEISYGPIPEGQYVCHSCDNRACVRLAHLFLGSPAENLADMKAKGRSLTGERNPHARLTTDQVREIRRRYRNGGITQAELAIEFGVVEGNVWNVLHGRSWANA